MTRSRKNDPADMTPVDWGDAWIVNDSLANRREARKLAAQGYEVCTLHPSWWACIVPWRYRRVGPTNGGQYGLRQGWNYILIVPPRNFRAEESLPWQN